MEGAIQIFLEMVDWVRPGRTVGEFLAQYEAAGRQRGGVSGSMVMHTCGLGADRPRVGPGAAAANHDWVIESGWTFTIKTLFRADETGMAAQVGEPVTVTDTGARRLGCRELVPFLAG
jgi:hypothetical protein